MFHSDFMSAFPKAFGTSEWESQAGMQEHNSKEWIDQREEKEAATDL